MPIIKPEPPEKQERQEPLSQVVRPLPRKARRPEGTMPQIADHEILRIIGTGAYGEVWLARTVTGAYRAVKVVWREDFDDERSFTREFEGVLQYEPIARNNPGLVHILHVGRHEGEFPYYYYVMELADDAYTGIHIEPGAYMPRTLRSDMQLYGLHAMPLDYVLEVGSQLAHALAGLHAEELIHRDVKPANVVFVNSRAKLADAGLVAHNSKRSFVGT
ncbi:MAG: protein kinase, partial [Akkermansia sp.]|nr:protein kinase [Akkermansia sp.]